MNKKMMFFYISLTLPMVFLAMENPTVDNPAIVVVWSKNRENRSFEDRCMYQYRPKIGHILGMFDGHGGWQTSSYLANSLSVHLEQQNDDNPCINISNALLAANKAVKGFNDGSTATVVNIVGGKCHFGQVGDSRAVLGSIVKSGYYMIDFFTQDHKPEGDERERVKAAGGGVFNEYVYVEPCLGGLAMTRSIGDYAKDPEKKVIIATPECTTRDVFNADDGTYLVLATDGLWDELSNEDVFHTIGYGITHGGNLSDITKMLVEAAVRRGSADDITCMLVDLKALADDKKASLEIIDAT